jgi:hypothetical protein
MFRTKLFKILRIMWSVWWGVLTVFLCVSWVRSYWRSDLAYGAYNGRWFQYASERGQVDAIIALAGGGDNHFRVSGVPFFGEPVSDLEFGFQPMEHGLLVKSPHYALVTIATCLALIPWARRISYRFSLRTLLIVMTLVATGLGAVVWLSR